MQQRMVDGETNTPTGQSEIETVGAQPQVGYLLYTASLKVQGPLPKRGGKIVNLRGWEGPDKNSVFGGASRKERGSQFSVRVWTQ